MPFPLLAIPIADIQCVIDLLEIRDLVVVSLCSQRTRNLVQYSKRKVAQASVYLNQHGIRLCMVAKNVQQEDTLISFRFFHTYIEISHIHGIESWRKQDSEERSHSDWLAHLLSIFNKPIIQQLEIGTINHIIYLDAIKNLITKCKILKICENCSDDLAKIAVIKLSAITLEKVETYKNRFVSGNYISDILTYNLKSLHLNNSMNQYEVNFEDLLSANIRRLSVHTAIITDKELNQFVQVWMKSSDKFYRLQRIYLSVSNELSRKEILRGIRYKNVDNKQRVNRDDMKELIMDI